MYNGKHRIIRIKHKSFIEEAVIPAGFITGRSGNICVPHAADVYAWQQEFYYETRSDHEGLSHACDPNYHEPNNVYAMFKGPYSVTQRCLSGKSLSQLTFEYAEKFLEQYKNEATFLQL